ncbi:unnamed protein product [Closterium sp. NIES-65]|nr:unnamed protein product [Closterium sp. NIES-65]
MCRAPLIGGIDQVFPNRALAQLVEQARIIGVTRQQRLAMSAVAAALPASHVTNTSGRRFLLLCARARRWFLVNEPRIRFSLFLAVSALLVFYLRVQEEEYARVTRYP